MSKPFDLGDILTVTTGLMVGTLEGLYAILNHMTGENLFTHQLPRAGRAADKALREQLPWLADIDAETKPAAMTWEEWVASEKAAHGPTHFVARMTWGYEAMDPIEEMAAMMGPENVIVVTAPDAEATP